MDSYPIEDEESFNEEVKTVCDIYQKSIELNKEGIHVISCDEKSRMQALEREITPLNQIHIEKQDNSYNRHGTQCLIANFEVATGKILCPTIQDTHPDAQWNTHKSKSLESLVRLVATLCGLTELYLGIKGKNGIL